MLSGSISNYDLELSRLEETYASALGTNIAGLLHAILAASGSSIIGIGSGGSFTIATLLCDLHEAFTGRVSRASTPLEIVCNPTLASTSPLFFVSAEGKNPDIREAFLRARTYSGRSLNIITNRPDSPLVEAVKETTAVNLHCFPLLQKDGYLATNSLLYDSVLVARSYEELNNKKNTFPSSISDLGLQSTTIPDWSLSASDFGQSVTERGNLIILYSPQLRSIAIDLESRLSESALLFCQVIDIRSFAHGRHLWLARRPDQCAILAIMEPMLNSLWIDLDRKIPKSIPRLVLGLQGKSPKDLIAGLVSEMSFVSILANNIGIDPASPSVPPFGREVHYTDLTSIIPSPEIAQDWGVASKFASLGGHWPSIIPTKSIARRSTSFRLDIQRQRFRAIVFDFDGTLVPTQTMDSFVDSTICSHLIRLAKAGVIIGIATGRGESVKKLFSEAIPSELWPQFKMGLYNCGYICTVDSPIYTSKKEDQFIAHVQRIISGLTEVGVPIRQFKTTQPFQISVRFHENIPAERMWFVIADALRRDGLDPSGMVCSKHSVDIIANGIGKPKLVTEIIQRNGIDPHSLLTIGDQGSWPGNDAALLEHRFSLSVDMPSRRLDRGWKFAPYHKRDVDATQWYLERFELQEDGWFMVNLESPETIGLV